MDTKASAIKFDPTTLGETSNQDGGAFVSYTAEQLGSDV